MKKDIKLTDAQIAEYQTEYSENKLWSKLKRFARRIGEKPTYYIVVLYYVLVSAEVSLKNKALILGALGYFILPLDMVADLLPLVGYTDDILVIMRAYKAVKDSITPDIEERVNRKLKEWFP